MAQKQQPAVLVITVEVAEEDVSELNRWYKEEHEPDRLALPGYKALRRFRAADGSPKFLAIYELEYPEAASAGATGVREIGEPMKQIMAKWKRERDLWIEIE